jgi:predicted AlkP superfamily pyrophosphatase or phosphodiesterase
MSNTFLKVRSRGCCQQVQHSFLDPQTHVTCLNTGLDVASGVYEWFTMSQSDRDRSSSFSYAGDRQASLRVARVDPQQIYPTKTIYEELHKQGITSHVIQHLNISHSTYSQMMFRGAHVLPYATPRQAMKNMIELSQASAQKPDYAYFYFGDIDAMGHRQGIGSPGFEKAVDGFFTEMEENFWKKLNRTKRKVACVLVADHGMVPVDPQTTLYLKSFPVSKYLKRNKQDNLIAPPFLSRFSCTLEVFGRKDILAKNLKARRRSISQRS